MTTRTDIHSPGSIVPADYTFLFAYAHPTTVDGWPVPGYNMGLLIAMRTGEYHLDPRLRALVLPLTDNNGEPIRFSKIHKNGPCDACGAHHIEGSVFFHVPSQEAIALGWQCAEKMDLHFDASERALISGNRKKARQAVIEKAQRRIFLRSFVENAPAEFRAALKIDHGIIRDIRARIIRYEREPSLSQVNLVMKIAKEEEQPKEKHVPAPISEKRQRIEGKIIKVKWHESVYGGAHKITVKVETPDGSWFAWGTLPGAISEATDLAALDLRGATVVFDAKLVRSDDSEHFAFFKRPTKPVLLKLDSDEARYRLEKYQEEIDDAELDLTKQDSAHGPFPASSREGLEEWITGKKAKRDILAALLA